MNSYALYIRAIFLVFFPVIMFSLNSYAEPLIRHSSIGEVEVDISIINPKILYSGDELVFSAALSTHSVSLDQYVIEELFYLRNQRGVVFKALAWESPKGGGHHRFGNLRFPGKDRDESPVILNDDKYIEVLVKGLAGVKESVFRWELPLYGENVR